MWSKNISVCSHHNQNPLDLLTCNCEKHFLSWWLTQTTKGNQSESMSSRFLPNSAVRAYGLKVLLCCPLWPKHHNRFEQYELFKFLLWTGSTFERHGSKLRTSGKQQKCMRFLVYGRLVRISSSVCLAHCGESRSWELISPVHGCKLLTEAFNTFWQKSCE